MFMPVYFSLPLSSFVATFIVLFLIAKIALRAGFVDVPRGHKSHSFAVPPVGGIALFLVIVAGSLLTQFTAEDIYFLVAIAVLVVVGVVDDQLDISVGSRVISEILASFIMAFGAGIALTHFGNLLGFGIIYLPWSIGLLFTVIAVFGTINAWNMIDGIDGLAGTMALLSVISFLAVTVDRESLPATVYLLLGGLVAFLFFNFSTGKWYPKVFLGDAGSKLIGFSLVWFMIRDTQGEGLEFKPATALFVMGLPIMDMTSTVLSRVRRRKSPFSPDRTHIHHVMLALGLSKLKTLFAVVCLAIVLNALGILLHRFQVVGYIQFAIYSSFFVIYHVILSSQKKRLETQEKLAY